MVRRMTPEQDAYLKTLTNGGYLTAEEIAETIESDDDPKENPHVEDLLPRIRARMEARHDELRRRGTSAYARLRRAFDELEGRKVIVRENYWCCNTCGFDGIAHEMAEEENQDTRGFVFFHQQDTDRVVESNVLLLRFGGFDEAREGWTTSDTTKMGHEIVDVLQKNELEVSWNGAADEAISVAMEWDKPPPL